MISGCAGRLCCWCAQPFRRRRSLSGDGEVAGQSAQVAECGRRRIHRIINVRWASFLSGLDNHSFRGLTSAV